jgi:CubicO group peptidase (beta-lactamase class C family)
MSHARSALPFLAVATVIALTGCTADAVYVPGHVSGDTPAGDAVELADDGLDGALEELPSIVQRVLEESGVPGAAVAVVRDDEALFADGFGVKVIGGEDPIAKETVFQIASMSKPIGATVVATQVDAGVVAWNTPAAPLLPGFALADRWVTEHVTIGDLYAHRSGLPMAAGDDLEDIGYDRDQVLRRLRFEPLDPYRTTYNYANFGMTTGAEAVANAAGVDWETLSEQELYEPLGMDSTSSRYDDFLARDDRATLHALVDGTFQPLYERDPDAQSPAGGVSSNVTDIAKWMSLIIGQGTAAGTELIDPDALTPAISAEVVSGHPPFPGRAGMYGYGFNVGSQPSGRVTLSHSGAFTLGAATNFQIVPELGLGVVALTNAGPVGAAEAIVAEFLDRVQFGESTRDWYTAYNGALGHYYAPAGDLADATAPADPAASAPLDQFAGTWTNEYFGDAVVELDGDTLTVRLGPDGGYSFDLERWDGDTFAFVPTGENAPYGSRSSATFELGGGAGRDRMTLQFFNANKLGTWTR